jgi:hypothetical protein
MDGREAGGLSENVNTPKQLASEAARPWSWSLATWGLILLGPLAAAASVVTRPEPVVTPLRTLAKADLERDIGRSHRDGRLLLRNLVVQPLAEDAGDRLTGERVWNWRDDDAPYMPFELVVPSQGVTWRQPPADEGGWRRLRRWMNDDEPALLADGQPMELTAFLAETGVTFDQRPPEGSAEAEWLLPMLAGLAGGLALAGTSRLVGGPRESGFGDLAKVKNPEPPKVDLKAIEAEQRAKAQQLDSYLDEVVAGGGEAVADNEDAGDPDDETDNAVAPTAIPAGPATPRQLVQDDAPRPVAEEKEALDYDSGEFYPTATRRRS